MADVEMPPADAGEEAAGAEDTGAEAASGEEKKRFEVKKVGWRPERGRGMCVCV